MLEIIKKNWFVVLIAILLCGFAIYYVWDTTKDFVKGKSVDGQDIIASIDDYDLSADELYDEMSRFSLSQLYYRFRNAVIEQSVTEETDGDERGCTAAEGKPGSTGTDQQQFQCR